MVETMQGKLDHAGEDKVREQHAVAVASSYEAVIRYRLGLRRLVLG